MESDAELIRQLKELRELWGRNIGNAALNNSAAGVDINTRLMNLADELLYKWEHDNTYGD